MLDGTALNQQTASPSAAKAVNCSRCGRRTSKWEERTAYTVWQSIGGKYAYPEVHRFTICNRCLTIWEGSEAVGAVIFGIGVAMLFSWFLGWPKFLWAWDPAGHLGAQSAKIVFGTMGLGAALFLAMGLRRWLDAKALDARPLPKQPDWNVMTVLPEMFDGISRQATAFPDRESPFPRVAWGEVAGVGGAPLATGLTGECQRIIIEFLLSQRTREFETANEAWWSRDDLVLTLFKAGLHERHTPEALTAAANAAIDGMVNDGLLRGTDSGYRASATLTGGVATGRPLSGATTQPAACGLCGVKSGAEAVSVVCRTGCEASSFVADVARHSNQTVTTTQHAYGDILDYEVPLCHGCWIDGRRRWRYTLRAAGFGVPLIAIVAMAAIIYGIESPLLGFGLLAACFVGFLAGFIPLVKWIQASHPMARLERLVTVARSTREGSQEYRVICASWPPPRRRGMESGY